MTLVLALRGSDGFVLAGDCKANEWHDPTPAFGDHLEQTTSTFCASKLRLSQKHPFMCAFAETDAARYAADLLIQRIDSLAIVPVDIETEIRDVCEIACGNSMKRVPLHLQTDVQGTLIVVNTHNRVTPIYRAAFTRFSDGRFNPNIIPSGDKHVAGYLANSAIFYLEKYYSFWSKPTVSSLALLAGHVIIAAAYIGKDRIDGLEIAVCKNGGLPCFVQKDTIREIYARSIAILKNTKYALSEPLSLTLATTRDELMRPPLDATSFPDDSM